MSKTTCLLYLVLALVVAIITTDASPVPQWGYPHGYGSYSPYYGAYGTPCSYSNYGGYGYGYGSPYYGGCGYSDVYPYYSGYGYGSYYPTRQHIVSHVEYEDSVPCETTCVFTTCRCPKTVKSTTSTTVAPTTTTERYGQRN